MGNDLIDYARSIAKLQGDTAQLAALLAELNNEGRAETLSLLFLAPRLTGEQLGQLIAWLKQGA